VLLPTAIDCSDEQVMKVMVALRVCWMLLCQIDVAQASESHRWLSQLIPNTVLRIQVLSFGRIKSINQPVHHEMKN
jgi:hypothetical protein